MSTKSRLFTAVENQTLEERAEVARRRFESMDNVEVLKPLEMLELMLIMWDDVARGIVWGETFLSARQIYLMNQVLYHAPATIIEARSEDQS